MINGRVQEVLDGTGRFWTVMIEEAEDYFAKGCGRCDRFDTPDCSALKWASGLFALREICLSNGLQETVKWGHPCYEFAGRNIVIFGAFQGDFRLSFFNPSLMSDPEGVLEKAGPNTQHAGTVRFTSQQDVADRALVLNAYLQEAKGYAERGIKPVKEERVLEMPEELIDALDADPELAEAFKKLTPGRERSYLLNLNGAKQSATRVSRIEKFRSKIIAGKGALER